MSIIKASWILSLSAATQPETSSAYSQKGVVDGFVNNFLHPFHNLHNHGYTDLSKHIQLGSKNTSFSDTRVEVDGVRFFFQSDSLQYFSRPSCLSFSIRTAGH